MVEGQRAVATSGMAGNWSYDDGDVSSPGNKPLSVAVHVEVD